jgi:hypothetical protein
MAITKPFNKTKQALIKDWQADVNDQLSIGNLAEFTRRNYQLGVGQFLDWADAHEIDQVNHRIIQRWATHLQTRGHDSNTIGVWIAGLMSFLA